MKNGKKVLSFMVSLILILSLGLSGCSKAEVKSDATTEKADVATTEKATEKVAVEKVKLRLMTLSTDEVRINIMDKFIKPNIEAAFPNVEVELELGGGGEDFNNKIKTYNASGDLPDVWYSDASIATPIIQAGNMLDLTNYITDDGFISKYSVPEALVYKDNKIYTLASGADTYFTPRIFYNKQIFKDNNIEIPTTFDELLAVCAKLKENNIIPISLFGKGGWSPQVFLFQTMVQIEDPDVMNDLLSNKTDFSNPVVKNALGRIEQLAKSGAFPEGVAGLDYGPAKELFTTDKAAMYCMFTWELPALSENPNYDFFPWPSAGEKFDGNNAIQYWGSPLNGYAVSAKSEHIEEAVALAEFCAMQDALYFNSTNAPVTLDTGSNPEITNELMKRSLEQYNNSEIKISSFTLNGMDAKVNAEFASLGAKLLTGEYTADQFIKDFTATWEGNTIFK